MVSAKESRRRAGGAPTGVAPSGKGQHTRELESDGIAGLDVQPFTAARGTGEPARATDDDPGVMIERGIPVSDPGSRRLVLLAGKAGRSDRGLVRDQRASIAERQCSHERRPITREDDHGRDATEALTVPNPGQAKSSPTATHGRDEARRPKSSWMTAPNLVVVAASAGAASVRRNSPDVISIASRFMTRPPALLEDRPGGSRRGHARNVLPARLAAVFDGGGRRSAPGQAPYAPRMRRPSSPTAVERLAYDLTDRRPDEPSVVELLGWLSGSARFRAFAEAHQDKIHKKLRTATDAEVLRDVRAELRTARLLLADPQFDLSFEAYGSGKAGPDFSVAFRAARSFNLEVTRIQARTH